MYDLRRRCWRLSAVQRVKPAEVITSCVIGLLLPPLLLLMAMVVVREQKSGLSYGNTCYRGRCRPAECQLIRNSSQLHGTSSDCSAVRPVVVLLLTLLRHMPTVRITCLRVKLPQRCRDRNRIRTKINSVLLGKVSFRCREMRLRSS